VVHEQALNIDTRRSILGFNFYIYIYINESLSLDKHLGKKRVPSSSSMNTEVRDTSTKDGRNDTLVETETLTGTT